MPQKRFAVVGHPIGHTMSPFIHQKLLELCGVDGTYTKLDIPPQELAARFADTLRLLDGFNVTIPHKQAVLPLLDEVSGDAANFGSVNTVAVRGGKATGYTTDGIGFVRALSAAGIPLKGHVLLLGSGGVARVFANEILRMPAVTGLTVVMRRHASELPCGQDSPREISEKAVLRRSRENTFVDSLDKAIRNAFAERCPQGKISVTDSEALEHACAAGERFSLLVNGTSAGMYPNLSDCSVSKQAVGACSAVFDAVYNPGITMLLKYAKEQAIPCAGGMGMLVWQAASAEEIWLGCRFRPQEVSPIIEAASQTMRRQFGNVVLCGFMGCGKSTAGQLLAQKLGRDFVDMDTFIEQRENKTVSTIFAENGEEYFRHCEADACRTLTRRSGLVIATGGGTLLNTKNVEILRETGIIALLQPPYETIVQRLAGDHTRPLLERPDKETAMRKLYESRMPQYQAAADLAVTAAESAAAAQELAALLAKE